MGVIWSASWPAAAFMDTSDLISRVVPSYVVAELDWSSDAAALVLCYLCGVGSEPYAGCN